MGDVRLGEDGPDHRRHHLGRALGIWASTFLRKWTRQCWMAAPAMTALTAWRRPRWASAMTSCSQLPASLQAAQERRPEGALLWEQLVAERKQQERIEEELLDIRQPSGAAPSAAFRATTIVDTPNCRISRLRSRRGSASEYHLRARRGSHSYFVNRGSA
jgi:hypothetical protein